MEPKKSSRRTAQEIIQDKMNEIAKLQAKAVLESAKDNQLLDTVSDLILISREKYKVASRHFSTGAQSFDNRLKNYDLKIKEISTERDLQQAIREYHLVRKTFFQEVIESASEMIVNGDEESKISSFLLTQEEEFLANNDNDFSELEEARDQAYNDRITFTSSKKN